MRIKNDGPLSNGVKVTADNGAEIKGITSIQIDMSVDEFVTAQIEIMTTQVDTYAKAEYLCADPVTGELKEVELIQFKDGTEFVAADHA